MQTLNQDIKTGEFKQIYLLYGEEAFLKNSYKNRLKEAIIGDDTMNFARFEGNGRADPPRGHHAVFCGAPSDPGGGQRLF